MSRRLFEIDAARGLAVLLMGAFHFALIGEVLGLWNFAWYEPFWLAAAHAVRILFFWVFGVSIALSSRSIWGQGLRGLQLGIGAALASAGTFLVFGEDFVRFGILHFFAVAALFVRLFKGRTLTAFGMSLLILALIPWADFLDFWLFSPWDYVRLIPWMAVPLWGLIWGEMVYGSREPLFSWRFPILEAFGRHAFAFYLLHFPLLYFSLLAISKLIHE